MKSILLAAGALACFTSVSFADIGKVTISITRTAQNYFPGEPLDEEETPVSVPYKASITEAAHEAAILAGKNSTRTLTYSTKITNRQILEAMQKAELLTSISGWAIGENEGNLIAYKKNEVSVPVPESLLTSGHTSGGVGTGKEVEKFVASKNTLTETWGQNFTSLATGFSLEGVALAGSATGRSDETVVFEDYNPEGPNANTYTGKYRATFTLVGANSDQFLSGKATVNGTYSGSYTPPAPDLE